MTQRAYDNIQGVLSYVVLISLAIAGTFTMEYYNLLNAMDLTPYGKSFMPPFFMTAWAIFALAVIAKLWGGWVHNKFWIQLDLANKFYAVAEKIDPRRK